MANVSTVKTKCNCGQIYNVPESAIGKQVKCRACQTQFVCERLSEESATETRNEKPCDSCGKPIPSEKIICTHCGYNHRLGKKVKSRSTSPASAASKTAEVSPPKKKPAKAPNSPKKSRPRKKVQWGMDTVALSSGAVSLLIGLAIIGVGLLAGRIMIWGAVLVVIGFFGIIKGLVGKEGVW